MLNFTMSEDGMRASISGCRGGRLRLTILRICQELDLPIPAETLDEASDLETLRRINIDLLITRMERQAERGRVMLAEQARTRALEERQLPTASSQRIEALRSRARDLRQRAQYADDHRVYREEMAQASRLEQQAEALKLESMAAVEAVAMEVTA